MRWVSGVLWSVLAGLFALAAAYLFITEPWRHPLVANLIFVVFALGAAVCVRSARDSLRAARGRQRASERANAAASGS